MNEMVKNIKEIHKEDVCLFKIGSFYHTFQRDAYIISYLFGYKLKKNGNNAECGFPQNIILKVESKLENNKINYILIDRRNNYDVDEKEDFKNNNKYLECYQNANKYINLKFRIENISNYLMENIENNSTRQIINKVEEIIDEGRKI